MRCSTLISLVLWPLACAVLAMYTYFSIGTSAINASIREQVVSASLAFASLCLALTAATALRNVIFNTELPRVCVVVFLLLGHGAGVASFATAELLENDNSSSFNNDTSKRDRILVMATGSACAAGMLIGLIGCFRDCLKPDDAEQEAEDEAADVFAALVSEAEINNAHHQQQRRQHANAEQRRLREVRVRDQQHLASQNAVQQSQQQQDAVRAMAQRRSRADLSALAVMAFLKAMMQNNRDRASVATFGGTPSFTRICHLADVERACSSFQRLHHMAVPSPSPSSPAGVAASMFDAMRVATSEFGSARTDKQHRSSVLVVIVAGRVGSGVSRTSLEGAASALRRHFLVSPNDCAFVVEVGASPSADIRRLCAESVAASDQEVRPATHVVIPSPESLAQMLARIGRRVFEGESVDVTRVENSSFRFNSSNVAATAAAAGADGGGAAEAAFELVAEHSCAPRRALDLIVVFDAAP